MPTKPSTFRPPWMPARADVVRASDQRRRSARARGYDTRWDKASKGYLKQHPYCVCCMANGIVELATLVDHIIPHRGDRTLFWDQSNWQSLCSWCHDHVKAVIERVCSDVARLRLDRVEELWRPRPSR